MRVTSLLAILTCSLIARADALDDLVRAHMDWQRVPGLSVAVVKNGKAVAARGYGLANVETQTPARAETVYKIGSLSKPFLAAAVMLLAQDGKLQLDDSVRTFLPDAPESWNAITLRHLLSHTSGVVREPPGFDPYKVRPDAEVLASAYATPLQFAPGTKREYSNTGYYALAEVIRRVSKEEWSSFIAKRVFAPAGMTATRTTTLDIVPNRARGYETRQGQLRNAEDWLAVRPSGAFLSTAVDLARWPLTPASDTLGWFVDTIEGHRHVHHDGGVPGFVAEMHRFPDDGLTVAVLANIGNRDLSDLALQIAGMHIPGLIGPPSPAIADPNPRLTARLRTVLRNLPTFDATLFTEQAASFVREDLARGIADRIREQGPLRDFVLIERTDQTLRYRATYAHMTLFATFTLDADGRITAWALTD
ncbi:MAG TPA: serine hydrolase domain-containing protein [Thermoanaerobaculia bacterium]|nr:serine hydrolase domain-containing protein [Thermoanaerobaculia bacterium]